MRKLELLAPAGSYESLMAAVNAGADAVYIGGSRFGARAYADNPEEDMLLSAIDYAHLHGRKIYLTVNTLMKETELCEELVSYLTPYAVHGLDAVIVQDLGALKMITQAFPGLDLHASTQMTVTGPEEARLLMKMGVSRIVTARELSLQEIRRLYDATGAEIESFVHGALCYCYSGQCLFSSLVGGRSGNRGRCAQPCRLPYQTKGSSREQPYLLSMKDLNTLELLPEIAEAGVYSLKIEGRMKRPEYTAGVVRIYRKYLDLLEEKGPEGYFVDERDQQELFRLFHRRGYTEGYYRHHNGREMMSLEEPDNRESQEALYSSLRKEYLDRPLREPVCGRAVLEAGKPARLEIQNGTISRVSEGAEVQAAQKQPLSQEVVRRQLEKTGNEVFYWKNLEVCLKGNCFLPMGKLNELRRIAFEELEKAILEKARRDLRGDTAAKQSGLPGMPDVQVRRREEWELFQERPDLAWSASAETEEQLAAALESQLISRIYLDSMICGPDRIGELAGAVHAAGKSCWLLTPQIYRPEAETYFQKYREEYRNAGFDGVLAACAEAGEAMRGLRIADDFMADHMIYSWNSLSREVLLEWGYQKDTAPAELTSRELKQRGMKGSEMILYGRLPMMVTAGCIQKTVKGCAGHEGTLWLKDRMQKNFPVKSHCRYCYNTIYNTAPLWLLDQAVEAGKLGCESFRLIFTTEGREETSLILEQAQTAAAGGRPVPEGEFTRGHWKRGVE